MRPFERFDTLNKIKKYPEFALLVKHGKLGAYTALTGLVFLILIVLAHEVKLSTFPEYVWGAILSIPITILCMGLFSVFYEYYMRTTFASSMRSVYWAWDTGVTVFPSHRDAPDRTAVLIDVRNNARLMSTTFSRYFTAVSDLVEQKLIAGVQFKFIMYHPDSEALKEKAREENCSLSDFRDEIVFTCRKYLGPLVVKYGTKIQVRFCEFNTPFAITILDERLMVLSLNVYGFRRSKSDMPCLLIENTYDHDSVFKLYERSFDAIWMKLDDTYPPDVAAYFSSAQAQVGIVTHG